MLLLAACPERAAAPAPRPATRVELPLPEGWTAALEEDHRLLAGPPGRPVLHIETWPGEAERLPDAAALEASLRQAVTHAQLAAAQARTEGGAVLLVYRLSLERGPPAHALLGAKRIGADLFLCSTSPGASEREVELAAKSCAGLSLPGN